MKNFRISRVIYVCVFFLLLFPAASPVLAPQATTPASDIIDLPAAAQGAISAAIGADDPNYHFNSVSTIAEDTNAWHTAHARHGFIADLGAQGAVIDTGSNRLMLNLSAYGCGADLRQAGKAVLQASANRIQYVREEVTEWYVNGPFGLEHGFTVARSCNALDSSAGSLLTLVVSFDGNLSQSLDEDEAGLTLTNARGEAVLRYSGLAAWDADGKELSTRFELLPSERLENSTKEVAIRVETRGARYPITVDPWIQNAKLTASDGVESQLFGYAVAAGDDLLVVGAPRDDSSSGSAYVFVKPSTGWADMHQTAKLTASDREAFDQFGCSVAAHGDTVVVGANGDDNIKGSAYVYVKPASGWQNMTETGKLSISDVEEGGNFGYSVAVSGDTVVIGARFDDDSEKGAAYVFVKPSFGWSNMSSATAKLTASNGETGDWFGSSVAVSGDVIVVGAPAKENLTGSAYVFVKPSGGWNDMDETAILTAPVEAGNAFGGSVSISNDVIVVSAPNAESSMGEAYVFLKPAGGWVDKTADARLTASDRKANDAFGVSVAISGDVIVVGTPDYDAQKGAAYLYVKPGSGWEDMTETSKLSATGSAEKQAFGRSVATNGRDAVCGAHHADANKGAAYVFDSSMRKLFLPLVTR